MKILILIFLNFFVLGSCSTIIKGQFTDFSGNAVYPTEGKVNVVRILPKHPYLSYISEIDKEGRFKISDIKPGKYFIEPLIPNFKSQSTTVDVKSDLEITLEVEKGTNHAAKSLKLNMDVDSSRGNGAAQISPPNL